VSAPLDIDAIQKRVDEACPAPWTFVDTGGNQYVTSTKRTVCALAGVYPRDADLSFIAHAREDIPALLSALKTMRAEMQRYQPILERAYMVPSEWESLAHGTGIATLNGYRAALALVAPSGAKR
jgi:hypothetical protein